MRQRELATSTHSHQHRSESAQLLTQLGRSPGDIDFLDYCGEREAHSPSR